MFITLLTEMTGDHTVRLQFDQEGGDIPFKVHLHHPSSGWLHRYHCGSLRKAMEFIDGPLAEEIAKGIDTTS